MRRMDKLIAILMYNSIFDRSSTEYYNKLIQLRRSFDDDTEFLNSITYELGAE